MTADFFPPPAAANGVGFVRDFAVGVILGGAVVLVLASRMGKAMRERVRAAVRMLAERVRCALTGETRYVAPSDPLSAPITFPV